MLQRGPEGSKFQNYQHPATLSELDLEAAFPKDDCGRRRVPRTGNEFVEGNSKREVLDQKNGLLIPDGSLWQKLEYAAKHAKEIPDRIQGQLGMEILQSTPEERKRNGIYIFAHLPDRILQEKFPLAAISYHVIFARVFSPRHEGESTTCKFLKVSRFNLLPQSMNGELRRVNGTLPKDTLEDLKQIDQLAIAKSKPIDHPVLHLQLLRDILKCCDSYIKSFKYQPARSISGGDIGSPNGRGANSAEDLWNGFKHVALEKYLQYAEVVEELYGLPDIFDWKPIEKDDMFHKQIELKSVGINDQFLIFETLGIPAPEPADKTIEVRPHPDNPNNNTTENESEGLTITKINLSALGQKVNNARRGIGNVTAEERDLYARFQ